MAMRKRDDAVFPNAAGIDVGASLGAFYRRLCSRMDKPRANIAVAHKLARMVYFMLTSGEAFVDKGQQHYEEQQRQRSIAALRRRAAALGFAINPASAQLENHRLDVFVSHERARSGGCGTSSPSVA
jgi:hypothetical protein